MDSVFGTRNVEPDPLPQVREYMQTLTELMGRYVRPTMPSITLWQIKAFLEANTNIHIDIEDAHGRTPLMIACGEGAEDVALLLLGKGANPKKKCYELNTLLHFTCRLQTTHLNFPHNIKEWIGLDYPIRYSITRNPLNLVKVLLEHGATFESNDNGWTPAHYAAFFEMTDVVEYFIQDHRVEMSISDQIMTFEILVFSLSVFQFNLSSAKRYLEKALKLRLGNGYSLEKDKLTDLERFLGHTECTQIADLSKVNDLECLKVQGFLIGDRVLPECVKDRWLWPSLFRTYIKRSRPFYFRLCEMVIRQESQGNVAIGTALSGIENLFEYDAEQAVDLACQNGKEILYFLRVYKDIIQNARPHHLAQGRSEMYQYLKSVQREVVNAICTSSDNTTFLCPYLSTLADVVEALNEAADKYNFKRFGTVMFNLYSDKVMFKDKFFTLMLDDTCKFMMVMQAYSFLLKHEDPSYHDPLTSETILHHLVYYLKKFYSSFRRNGERSISTRHIELVHQVVCKVIRYGCPLACRDKRGRTALDVATEFMEQFEDKPEMYERYKELVEVLKDSPVYVSLQELAARVIIQKKIPYHEKIPTRLCNLIDNDIV